MDVYYNPEQYDLQLIGEVSWSYEPYSFDLTAVWRDSVGRLYWASDSGCSCPSPFEWAGLEDLETGNRYELHNYLVNRAVQYAEPLHKELMNQIVEILSRIQ